MALAHDSRGRSTSTTERAEKVDVHQYSQEPQSPYQQQREVDSRLDVESPSTSNNSAVSPSSSHRPVYHQYQQQQSPAQAGVFHSLPRSGAQPSSSSSPAGQTSFESPCPSSSCCSPNLSNSNRPDRDSPVLSVLQVPCHLVSDEAPESSPSKSVSREEEEDSLCSSEYTEPNTFPTTQIPAKTYEEAVSRDSYELLSDSSALFVSAERMNRDDDVSYILHRRVQSNLAASKSCEVVAIAGGIGGGSNEDQHHAEESCSFYDSVEMSVQRSRSFRSLREKTYRERPALYARARLMEIDIDLNVIDPPPAACSRTSLVRPKSIEFVSFQDLPPPDAFSCRDDTVDASSSSGGVSPISFAAQVTNAADASPPNDPAHVQFVPVVAEPCFPVFVDVHQVSDSLNRIEDSGTEQQEQEEKKNVDEDDEDDDDKMCSLSQDDEEEEEVADVEVEGFTVTSSVSVDAPLEDEASAISHQPHTEEDDEALTADDVQDDADVCQDTLSSTSDLEEQLVSEDHLFEFVNDDDGLPDPESPLSGEHELHGIYDITVQQQQQQEMEFVFEAHVLSRISERSSDSKLSSKGAVDEEGASRLAFQQDDTMSDVSSMAGRVEDDPVKENPTIAVAASLTLPPPPPVSFFEEATPVNEAVTFVPSSHQVVMDEFPSPPSSIDNLPDDECYSDSSS